MSYTSEWTSVLSSEIAQPIHHGEIPPSEELAKPASFLTFLATAQKLEIPILATTWEAGASEAGLGGTSIILSSDIDLTTEFAYKRIHEWSKRTMTEMQLMSLLVAEIAVLGHRAIRQHAHITQLRGICWDVSHDDDKPWPVLVFERSVLGNMYSYFTANIWRKNEFEERATALRHIIEIGSAIATMHSIHVVHGDIKPENALIFPRRDEPSIAKLIDFGYSLRFSARRPRLKLPISRPWNAPEHTRSAREWTFEQAVKTDIFSYGMLCLWVLFGRYFENLIQDKRDGRYGISTVKENIRQLSDQLLNDEPYLTVEQRKSLRKFFASSLHEDPEQRESNMLKLLRVLDPKQFVIYSNLTSANIEKSIQDLYCSDYRVRLHVTKEILGEHQNQPAFALQRALCYTIGFGIERDEAKAANILAENNIEPQSLHDLVAQCKQQASIHPSMSMHKLWRMSHVGRVDLPYQYLRQGKLRSAQRQLLKETNDLQEVFGKDTTLATALETELVGLYEMQGRLREAQELQERMVARHKRLLGEEHLDTLTSVATLASILSNRGLWRDAEQLQVKCLGVTKRAYGGDNYEVFSASFGLALTYIRQGEWWKAGEIINSIGEMSRGQVSAVNVLLLPYHIYGMLSLLEECSFQAFQYCLDTFHYTNISNVLGENHPIFLTTMSLWGLCLAKYEKWAEAEEVQIQVLNTQEQLLDGGHPDTFQSMTNLAVTLKYRGRLESAKELQTRAASGQNRVLGRDHPDTLSGLTNLASIYLAQGRWKEAEELESENVKLKQMKMGERHRETLVSMINLVSGSINQGRINEATQQKKQVMERCHMSWEKVPYDAWIDVANMSLIMFQSGWWEEAESLQRQLVEMSAREFGEHQSLTVTSKSLLASTLWRRGEWEAAKELQMQTVERVREYWGENISIMFDCEENLKEMRQGLHRGVQMK
ncbi:hypothetical protein MGN70_003404 [Eutypa lata]|nr:hypothetical protein MGN70_003404 [Eutypa lata]